MTQSGYIRTAPVPSIHRLICRRMSFRFALYPRSVIQNDSSVAKASKTYPELEISHLARGGLLYILER